MSVPGGDAIDRQLNAGIDAGPSSEVRQLLSVLTNSRPCMPCLE